MPATIPRLFVEHRLDEGATLAPTPGQLRYLQTVLRRPDGAAVRLFNGCDGEWLARCHAGRGAGRLEVEHCLRAQQPEPGPWLLFALLKRDATDMVVQKATELGAGVLQPLLTERTNAARTNLDRLSAIATEAAEQCERLTLPQLRAPLALGRLLDGWPEGRSLVVAVERLGEQAGGRSAPGAGEAPSGPGPGSPASPARPGRLWRGLSSSATGAGRQAAAAGQAGASGAGAGEHATGSPPACDRMAGQGGAQQHGPRQEWPGQGRAGGVAADESAHGYAGALLVGPEGGFTDAELDALAARPFVLPATLGPRILRADTAAIAGLALLQAGRLP